MSPESRDEIFFGAERPAGEYDHGRAPLLYGIGWFFAVLLFAFVLWLADFQVDATVQKVVGYSAAVAFAVFLVRRTPDARVGRDVRARRQACRAYGLVGGMTAVLLLGTFVAAFQLRTWADWIIFGVIALMPIGVGIMLHTRFTIGKY